jgi:uncharacterized protein (TIGR02246 family)
MTKTPDAVAVAVAEPILERLQQAWNAGDGMGFAGPFAENADFVEIRGGHHRGAVAVGRGHEAIFSTIYAGSTVELQLEMARTVAPGAVVALVHSTMTAPTGPMAGVNQARMTMVIVEGDERWAITAFHNTLVAADRVSR